MKNAMQLKAIVKNMAKDKKISAQLILQNYMLERFLERVSLSSYMVSSVLNIHQVQNAGAGRRGGELSPAARAFIFHLSGRAIYLII